MLFLNPSKRDKERKMPLGGRAAWQGILTAAVALLITCLCGTLFYVRSVQALKDEVRANLIRTATVAAAIVDGDAHKTFRSPAQETSASYYRAIRPLAQVQQASGDIKFIYTCVLRQNKVYFVLDPTPPGDHTGDGVDDKSHIMQLYPEANSTMIEVLRTGKPLADAEPTRDEWGMLISGYAPIYDSQKHLVGIVGVDLAADRYAARLASMRRAALSGLALAAVLALAAGLAVFLTQSRLSAAETSRRSAVDALQQAHNELEARVEARTADLADANVRLNHAYTATIEGWSHALDLRDRETEGHSRRVTEMTLHLAQALGVPPEELVHFQRGALLHDIGKMGVPDRILLKPGPLDDDEWRVMRRHPQDAHDMLFPIAFLRPALDIPLCHHEKWDGTGYPQGLRGDEIPLPARLFAMVDVWDALISDRPYRKAWPRERVVDHLHSLAGTHFDPEIVPLFLRLLEADMQPHQRRLAA